eukprot:scaffold294899_cov31-Prasinocladus_malaysianus.AAC.1
MEWHTCIGQNPFWGQLLTTCVWWLPQANTPPISIYGNTNATFVNCVFEGMQVLKRRYHFPP